MTMKSQQDINYLLKIISHAETEINLGIDPEKRVWKFLETKSDYAKQEAKEKLLTYLQTPPNKEQNESDEKYLLRFYERNVSTEKYSLLLDYIK